MPLNGNISKRNIFDEQVEDCLFHFVLFGERQRQRGLTADPALHVGVAVCAADDGMLCPAGPFDFIFFHRRCLMGPNWASDLSSGSAQY